MTTREPALRAVLFDSGGTLARPKRGRWWPKPRFEELIIDAGLAIPPDEETRAALDAGVAYLSEHTVIRTLEEELAAYVGCYRMVLAFLFEGFPPGLDRRLAEAAVFDLDQTLYEDTASALEELRAAGVMLGIVSNAGPSLELRYRDMGFAASSTCL